MTSEPAPSYRMIDVGDKPPTRRMAVAEGSIAVGAVAFPLIRDHRLPKGDALALAEIAGIQGAKRASDLIPLCHPLPLDRVRVTHALDAERCRVAVRCLVSAFARTGVEMEAMAGVSAALLAIYDLTKMVEPALTISDARLLLKTGGKHGVWICPGGLPDWLRAELAPTTARPLAGCRAAVVTLSDRAAAGVYPDRSGPILAEALVGAGAEVIAAAVVPDDEDTVAATLASLTAEQRPQLVLTTGGTGVAPRDVTPEALRRLGGREIPGIGELLRQNGARFTPNAWSSRSTAAVVGETLVVALPGSPKAVTEGLDCLLPLLPHLLDMLAGQGHDAPQPNGAGGPR